MSARARVHELLESFSAPKHPDAVTEDMLADVGAFVVLVDGVSSKSGARVRGVTSGRFAAETVIASCAVLPEDVSAREAVDRLSDDLRDAAAAAGFAAGAPAVQMAVFSAARGEVWRVGNIHVRIGNGPALHTPHPPTDAIAAAFRAAVLEAALLAGATVEDLVAGDPAWEALRALLGRQDVFANRPGPHPLGYGAVNGTPVPGKWLEVFEVPAGMEVVFASDGYLSPEGTLADAESRLAEAIAADPLLFRTVQALRPAVPGGSFDDRAWVRFITHAR